MDNPIEVEIFAPKDDNRDRLVLHDEYQLACMGCGHNIVALIKIQEDDTITQKIQAFCSCGGKSFVKRDTGRFYMGPSEGVSLIDIKTVSDDKDFEHKIYVKVNDG